MALPTQLPKGTCTYLGHVSLDTTLVYAHVTLANEAGARVVLEQLRPPNSPVS